MASKRSQRGFISISGIFSLVVLVVIIFVGIKLVPPYVSNYQMQDAIQNLALIASYSPISEDEILRQVLSRARSCDIALQAQQVSVHKANGIVSIAINYTVPVDFIVRRMDLHFEPSTTNQNLMTK